MQDTIALAGQDAENKKCRKCEGCWKGERKKRRDSERRNVIIAIQDRKIDQCHLFSLELSIVSVAKNVSSVETFISLQTVV